MDQQAVHFLEKSSFVTKLHAHSQDFQIYLVIVKSFFIEHVRMNKGDLDFWMKKIFHPSQVQNDFLVFCQNVFSLFPDGGKPDLVMGLLMKFSDCIRDKVNCHAASEEHKKQYVVRVKAVVLAIRRGSRKSQMPSQ
jgi:hypothetical protein